MRLSALSGALAVLLFVYSDRCNFTLRFVWPPSSNAMQVTAASAIAESRRLLTTRHKGKKEEDGLGLVGSRETTAQLQYIVPVLDLQLPVDVFNFPGRRQRRRRQLRTRTGAMKGQGREKRKSEGRAEGGGRREGVGATVASVAGEWAARRWRRRAARRRRRRRGVRWSAERCGVRFSLTGRAEFYLRSPRRMSRSGSNQIKMSKNHNDNIWS